MQFNRLWAMLAAFPGARALWRRWPVGSIETRVAGDVSSHAPYAFGVLSAARLAKALGLPGISVVEFGVAGGRGLIALERISREVSQSVGIRIDVFGFDSGQGMPEASDYRDLPHVWAKGFYQMDVAALQQQLTSAQLLIGDVAPAPFPSGSPRKDTLPPRLHRLRSRLLQLHLFTLFASSTAPQTIIFPACSATLTTSFILHTPKPQRIRWRIAGNQGIQRRPRTPQDCSHSLARSHAPHPGPVE